MNFLLLLNKWAAKTNRLNENSTVLNYLCLNMKENFPSDLSLQSYAPFSTFFDFPIVSLWNFVNKISRKPFQLES